MTTVRVALFALAVVGCNYVFGLRETSFEGNPDAGTCFSQRTQAMRGSAWLILAACGSGDDGGMIDANGDGDAMMADASITVSGCDPLDDNDFDGPEATLTRIGLACPPGQGCYRYKNGSATTWLCADDTNPTLRHRSQPPQPVTITSCAQGYMPLMKESAMVSTVVCLAICKPGNAYAGNPGTQYPAGQAPHRCNSVDARGTFNETAGGDHCMYSWWFEVNQGLLTRSPTSDTVGFCVDHSKYKYDSNQDGMVDSTDANWPSCTSLPLTAGAGLPVAGDFGCVDSSLAGF